jgi:RNA 2',3'-cyclic 3'-phosphodiesterase
MYSQTQGNEPKIRLFFAVALGSAAMQALETASRVWREELSFASWHHPADYHVTVKFIGDVEPRLAEEVLPPVTEAVRGIPAFELTLGSLGVFGRPSSPSVLWCGVGGSGLDALSELQAKTEAAVHAATGIPIEGRPYRPHITLARRYRGGKTPFSSDALDAAERAPETAWRVDHLVLYRTHFGNRPAYEALAKLPLEGGG